MRHALRSAEGLARLQVLPDQSLVCQECAVLVKTPQFPPWRKFQNTAQSVVVEACDIPSRHLREYELHNVRRINQNRITVWLRSREYLSSRIARVSF